jgi:formate hydrogenlyase transcriptional activator
LSDSSLDSQREIQRYQALLELADLMVRHYSLSELFHELAQRLQKVAEFQLLHFGLHDPKENVMRRHLWEGEGAVVPEAVSLADSASGYVWQNQTSLLIRDLREDQRFPQVFGPLRDKGFRTYYVFPLTTAQSRLGALGVGSRKADAYGQQDLELLIRVAELVAIAVETAITKDALLEERRRLQALVDVNRELVSSLEMQHLLPLISECVTRVVPHDFAGVTLYEDDNRGMRAFVLSPADKRPVMEMGRSVTIDQTLSAQAFLEQRPQLLTRNDLSALTAPIATRMLDAGIQTVLCMPMVTSKGAVGTLNVGSKRDRAFSPQDAELLNQIAAQLAIALENARAYREIQALKGAAVGRKALPGRRNSDRTAL